VITIGIDPHKRSLTAAALDPASRPLGQLRVPVTGQAGTQLTAWAATWPQRRWAVEGATGLGRQIAQALIAAGETVIDVPAKLAARARLLSTGNARKTDRIDAASVAAAAIHSQQLRQVTPEGHGVIFRLLSDRRDDLVAERTRTLSRLHVLLAELHPGGAGRQLTATRAAALLRQIRPLTPADIHRKQLARELLSDVRRLDRQVIAATKRIRTMVAAHPTSLTQIFGVGPILAAKILGHTGDVGRFPNRDHFASYTGTAPVEASSGDVRRHRLNRGGNRQLNTALHIIAVCQIRDPCPGQAYYRRKLAEAKTPDEARRALKRHLSNVVHGHLVADHRRRNHTS
jgi:transposase